MDAIEKRARELLAAHLIETKVLWGAPLTDQTFDLGLMPPTMQACVRAIIAALTPPEGYVLVPAEPTETMIAAAWRHGDGDEAPDPVYSWRAMLAARPEVPGA